MQTCESVRTELPLHISIHKHEWVLKPPPPSLLHYTISAQSRLGSNTIIETREAIGGNTYVDAFIMEYNTRMEREEIRDLVLNSRNKIL
jgi:hypothetical protein